MEQVKELVKQYQDLVFQQVKCLLTKCVVQEDDDFKNNIIKLLSLSYIEILSIIWFLNTKIKIEGEQ